MTPYVLLILSAAFRAITQMIVFNQAGQSWLPEWVFTWDLAPGTIFDAYHLYQGLWEVCAMVGFYLLRGNDLFNYSGYALSRETDWAISSNFFRWVIFAVIVVLYWQVFNLFYHIIFRRPEFWRWPLPFVQ